jgi:nucleotide-binding universal stress UspA family protein
MRVLLAVDGSKFSDAAVQAVIDQTRSTNGEVRVLHVIESPMLLVNRERGGYDPALDKAWAVEKKRAEALVKKTVERLRANGLKAAGTIEDGDPRSKILEIAKSWRADLIVLGSRGLRGLAHLLMGSVSEAVARHAKCSVEVVRMHAAS